MNLSSETINNIREWVKIDNEMRALKQEISNRKKKKDQISNSLIDTMKQNEIDSVNINNGKIEFTKRKTKKPISKKLLQNILTKYYKEDTNKANEVNEYILNNREETTKDIIVRKIDKST
jgi:CxxC motif-containing protein